MRVKLNIQRFADGKVIIDVVANTQTAEKDIDKLYNRLRELEEKDTHEIEWNGVKITGLSSLSDEELKEYDDISAKINEIKSAEAERLHEERLASLELEKQNQELEKQKMFDDQGRQIMLSNGVKLRRIEHQEINNELAKTNVSLKGIGNKLTGVVKKIGKWALALLGVRTILSILTRSFSTLKQYNSELAEKMEDMQLVLATALEPIIMWLVNMAERLLTIFATLYKSMFGIDLFAASSAKSMNKMAGSAKDTKKQLAGFDEMNVLQDNQGGGGGSTHTFNLKPKWDWSDLSIDKVVEWAEDLVDKLIIEINKFIRNIDPKELADGISKLILGLIDIVNKTFTDINWGELVSKLIETILTLDWNNILTKLVTNILITSFIFPIEILLGIIDGILSTVLDLMEDPEKWQGASEEIINGCVEGIKKCLSKIWDLMKSIWNKILQILGIHSPSRVFMKLGVYIMEGLINGIESLISSIIAIFTNLINKAKEIFGVVASWINENVVKPIANYFTNLWNNLKEGASNAWNNVISIFSNLKSFFTNIINSILSLFKSIGTKVGDAIGGAFKSVINGVLGAVEKILNSPIRSINSLLTKINDVPGINIKKLSTFSFPRLAKGGIISQPGRGVMVGNAIAGERGAEGVIPLTDSQQMALLGEAIGKYITINANITNTMNGRVISRELQRIQNSNDFAYNR